MKKVSVSTIMRQLIWNIYTTQLPNSVFIFADERDESLLEVYGLSSWASNLVEKQISIATLANLYTIIGL
ncbi:hypothetical protein ACIXN4_22060 [Bacteroides fragilis]